MDIVGTTQGQIVGDDTLSDADRVRLALSYPFEWPQVECVLIGDKLMNLARFEPEEPLASIAATGKGDEIGWVADHVRAAGGAIGRTAGFQTILASGSNASPSRMVAKFGQLADRPPVFFIPGTMDEHVSAYSCHFASYGSMPATLSHVSGASTGLIAIVVPTLTLESLHASEALGRNYGYFRQAELSFSAASGHQIARPHTYLSLRGLFAPNGTPRRLSAAASQGCDWPALSERQAITDAIESLGQRDSPENFVASLLGSDETRELRSAQLALAAQQPVDLTGWDRLA